MKSSRPYLLRALHEWIVDNKKTPHLMVNTLADGVDVPQQYIHDNHIVLNIAPDATGDLRLGNTVVTFKATFDHDDSCSIVVPIEAIEAIYAIENGRGMYFNDDDLADNDNDNDNDNVDGDETKLEDDDQSGGKGASGSSHLKIVK